VIVQHQIVAISPGVQSLDTARRLNFTVVRQDSLANLGISITTLEVPKGMSEVDALAALRAADPSGSYDYDHIYNPSGEGGTSAANGAPRVFLPVEDIRIGMIDGGVDTRHPALTNNTIVSQCFAGSGKDGVATEHGTAIASLLVGKNRGFSGYLPGAKLYAADVFGGAADGGSAIDIARALNWLAQKNIAVTNVSLTGPPNALLAAAVKAFVGSGHILVAAVGNDGPAAPPNYPAAYEGVIGVTSVDTDGHVQIDANRNGVTFAARGVDIRAAGLSRGYGKFTGTSYAAPVVTARFALILDTPNVTAAKAARTKLVQEAVPLSGAGLYLDAPAALLSAAQ
jgi:hypothetical protein